MKREQDVTSLTFEEFSKDADRFILIIDDSYIEGWIVYGTLNIQKLRWGPYIHVRFDGYFDKEKTPHPRAVAVFNFMSVHHISLEGKTLKIQIDDKN